MSKSLEQLFEEEKSQVTPKPKEQRMAPKKSLEDLFSPTPTETIEVDPSGEEAALRVVGKNLFALPIGAARGSTIGYSKKLEPESVKQMAEDYGVATGIGQFGGSFVPGGLLAKGMGAVSKIPGLASLGRAGLRSGAVGGGALGFAQNPEDSSRVENMLFGAMVGAPVGLGAKFLGNAMTEADIYNKMQKPGFSRYVKDEVDSAVKKMQDEYISPKKSALTKILGASDAEVKINPDYLRGLKRKSDIGIEKEKGGLDRLANMIEEKGGVVSPLRGQRLKEYFQQLADYQKRKPYETGSTAKAEGAGRVANILKGQLEAIDPRVSSLNEPMSEALSLKRNVLASSAQSPMSFVASKPSTDRGQQVLDLDAIAKTRLQELGKNIRESKQLEYDPESAINPLASAQTLYRAGKRGTGNVLNALKINNAPKGTRNALINSLIEAKIPEEEE